MRGAWKWLRSGQLVYSQINVIQGFWFVWLWVADERRFTTNRGRARWKEIDWHILFRSLVPSSKSLATTSKQFINTTQCRGFTPLLVEFFSDLKDYNDFALEIVFVSSDSDQGSFDEYWGSMNFAALPFDARTIKEVRPSSSPYTIFLKSDIAFLAIGKKVWCQRDPYIHHTRCCDWRYQRWWVEHMYSISERNLFSFVASARTTVTNGKTNCAKVLKSWLWEGLIPKYPF